ncbi:MAG: SLBB domain-containing protein, partial [Bacteroidota bacterium]
GDVLNVAKEKREIKVSGEVLFPTDVVFSKGQKLRYYIERAGGFTDNARRSKVYVLQPNGVAAKTRHFLFIRTFPKIEPGCEILVPKKFDKTNNRITLSETIALTSAIASLAGIVIAIVNVTKK